MSTPGLPAKSASLLALYFAQGLPFGFQATALPLLLRERGVSLQAIGFAGLLSLPWLLKALWAPLVDRFGSERFGRRKSWIVSMQAGLSLCALAAAHAPDAVTLFVLVVVMNLFAATQDIAVDGLAVSWLRQDELGPANAVQVVGYKLGMLTGGGLLVWASARIGRAGMFYTMATLMLVVLVVSLGIDERRPSDGHHVAVHDATLPWSEIAARLAFTFRHPATRALLLVVATYKMGEAMADAMWKPLLFDRGFGTANVGLWTGTFGMVFSLVGSAGAGWLVRRVSLENALLVAATVRTAGVVGEWGIALSSHPTPAGVIAVTCVEHAFGGAITTVLFALMMRQTDRAIGGTHYTLLASVEVWGKLPLGALSGVVAVAIGYAGVFGLASALCAAFALLVYALRSQLAAAPPSAPV